MILLAIDTSTRWAGVGLLTADGDVSETTWRSDQNHGRELMPAIIALLEKRNLTPLDVTHLAVALGPGGFSAVRVGISTVIGLSFSRTLPVAGLPTHAIEAAPYREQAATGTPLYSLLPAGRREISWARFESGHDAATETGLSPVEEMSELLPSGALVCGEAAELVAGKLPPEKIAGRQPPTRLPSTLLELARQQFDAEGPTPHDELRPIYARPPSISTPNPPR